MSENTSLTDAVKETAGISLTDAMKDVAGHRTWLIERALDAQNDAPQDGSGPSPTRLRATCARFAVFVVVTLALFLAGSGDLDAELPAPAAASERRISLKTCRAWARKSPSMTAPVAGSSGA